MTSTDTHLIHVTLTSVPNDPNMRQMSVFVEIDERSYAPVLIQRPDTPLEPWLIKSFNKTKKYDKSNSSRQNDSADEDFANSLFAKLLPTPELLGSFEHLSQSSHSALILDVTSSDLDLLAYPWEICAHANWKRLGILPPLFPIIVVRSRVPYYEKWKSNEKVRILVAGVMAAGLPTVNFEKEYREIGDSISHVKHDRESFEIQPFREATLQTLSSKIAQYKPHIIHIVTHGSFGAHYFETSTGAPILVSGSDLLRALSSGKDTLCMFVSTACMALMENADENTWGLGKTLSSIIPITIGMQISITEDAALSFTNEFYGSLAASYSVLNAFDQARERIRKERPGSPEWIAPVLYRGIRNDPILFSPENDIYDFLVNAKSLLTEKIQFLQGQNSFEVSQDIQIWKSLLNLINEIDRNLCDGLAEGHFIANAAQSAIIRKLTDLITKSRSLLLGICGLLETSGEDKEFRYKYSLGKDVSESITTMKTLRNLLDDLFVSYSSSRN